MSPTLSPQQLLLLRLRSQRLYRPEDKPSTAARVVKAVCGLQAQELPAARLSIRARSLGLTDSGVETTRVDEHTLVQTWAMRGTLHLLASQDLGWLAPLFGPISISASRKRNAQLGLDEDILRRGVEIIRENLAKRGALTREELAPELRARGVPTEGQALIHVIYQAAMEGVACVGPLRGSKPSYVLLEDWGIRLEPMDPPKAALRLAQRYLDGYAPAGPQDFAAWSGLPLRDARQAWEGLAGDLVEIEAAGQKLWMPASRASWLEEPLPDDPVVRLLPRYDTYLLGYASRDLVLPTRHARKVHPGGGIIHAVLLVDGQACGVWKARTRKGGLHIDIEPFEPLAPEVKDRLEEEVQDLGRFLGSNTTYSL